MIIIEAKTQDIDEIHALGNNVEEFNTTKEVVTFWPKQILKNCIKSQTDFILIAKDKKILGFTIANYNPTFKKAIIENIFVTPQHRGQKIGEKLITQITSKLKKLGCEYICILTENTNHNTIKFYEKMKFNRGKDCAWMDKILSTNFKK